MHCVEFQTAVVCLMLCKLCMLNMYFKVNTIYIRPQLGYVEEEEKLVLLWELEQRSNVDIGYLHSLNLSNLYQK